MTTPADENWRQYIVAKIGNSGAGGFIGRMAGLRQAQLAPKDGPKLRADIPLAAAQKYAAPLAEVGLDSKLVAQHGQDLGPAVGGLARLVAAGKNVPAWQSKSQDRVLQSSHKLLGALLSALPPAQRGAAAKESTEAWASLAENPAAKGRLPFAIACATGLVDSALRLQSRSNLTFTPEQLAGLGASTAKEVEGLLADNEGRDGRSTMLNLLPRLVEQLELGCQGLPGPQRAELVHDVRMFMQSALPVTGTSLSHAAELASAVSVEARKFPGDVAKILGGATKALAASRAPALKEAQGYIDHAPDPDPASLGVALHALVKAQIGGPSALFDDAGKTKMEVGKLNHRAGADAAKKDAVLSLVGLIEQAGAGPSAQAALDFIKVYGRALVDNPAAAAPLLEGLKANDSKALAKGLLNTMAQLYPRVSGGTATWDEALAGLDNLGANQALATALAHSAVAPKVQCDGDLIVALGQRTQEGKEQVGLDLGEFAQRWAQSASSIAVGPQRGLVLSAIVGQGSGAMVAAAQLRATAQLLKQLAPQLPNTDLTALVGDGPNGEPGLWALCDDQVGWANPPVQTLKMLLHAAQGAKIEHPNDYARLAMRVAHGVAFIQNGAQRQIPRIVADFGVAAKEPAKLQGVAAPKNMVALRAAGAQTKLLTYVADNQSLPDDFVLTAGVHMTADQVAWASKRVDDAHGHDPVRMLRDCVFGCVELNRNDLVEALRTSPSEPKAISRVIEEVAQAFRVNAMAQLPVDILIAGLKAGADPVATAADAKGKAALADLALDKVEGPLSSAGLSEVAEQTANIAELITQYATGFKSMDPDIDMGKLRPVLDEVLKSVVQGTWPAPKYEDEVGKRQLAVLSPAQQAIWRSSTIVSAQAAAAPAQEGPLLNEALTLLAGLTKMIPEQVTLPEGVSFDAECVTRLRGERDEALAGLRDTQKGSVEHRTLGKRAGELSKQLGLVELQVALSGLELKENPPQAFKMLLPLIPAAARALRKQGATGCASALKDVGYMLQDLSPAPSAPGQGRWAADQDSLTAMIASHKSGCLAKGDKRRRWGLAGSLADANTKMLRVFNGDKQVYRTFVRMLPVKIGKYEGPALFIEGPVADGGGNGDDRKLLDKALMDKARQMGVPAIGGNPQAPDGWKVIPNTAIEITFDPGHTGVYHSDRTGQQKHQAAVEPWKYNAQRIAVCIPPELIDQF